MLSFGLLPNNFQWLIKHCPVFPINGSKVRVITEPNEFYSELISKASKARNRISLSSLYLGTGKLEENLVSTLLNRAAECQDLKIHWLLDFTRGSRGVHNSRTMLQPLIASHPQTCSKTTTRLSTPLHTSKPTHSQHMSTPKALTQQVHTTAVSLASVFYATHPQVSLYHTPNLRGFLKWLIPQRWNEVIGLQHMKLYVFDDSLIMSGANLSNDYFTNRQDRYVAIENCPALADFYHRLIGAVSRYSLQLHEDNSTNMLPDVNVHPFLGDYAKYCMAMKQSVEKMWNEECEKNLTRLRQINQVTEGSSLNHGDPVNNSSTKSADSSVAELDTLVFPTVELGPFNLVNDSLVTNLLFESAEDHAKIQLASGYFNLTEEYKNCILEKSKANFGILMAHPTANGFLGAHGVAGGIPAAYTLIAKRFFNKIQQNNIQRVELFEYQRPKWTFHGKGLWYYKPDQSLPFLTMIGSPNFGRRSVNRDLESQLVIMTSNHPLQTALHGEQHHLYSSANLVTRQTFTQADRLVPYWIYMKIRGHAGRKVK
ncbi:CDP-diacylglycerol--glycerol-3-phosphate 3-phosphatidyltransferase, mitochondrial-like isoform X2 [Macrobrachium nipponense]|uniref:CDP-diacylglycerol--glycerol-3-phosphate 3-phosphatidyltransferase, mitochondrial-like isoform X2 n=1 Tax=Macrobrachium nipponense TaxID=159736 RepID=UPI0030C8465A